MPDELISFDEPTEPPKIRIICETCGSENCTPRCVGMLGR